MSERKIRLLDDTTINQIAAGEVIENSASVIKELVENALDAQSQNIMIETKPEFIRIIDDGCGIEKEDLSLAVLRHATSKLEKIHDLNALQSLGFRGEALASIASISKLYILSSNDESGKGSYVELQGGNEHASGFHPRRQGTTIEVKSLFYNVPVRRNFLKNLSRETSDIHKILTTQVLCNPSIGFKWIHQEKCQFDFEKDTPLLERIKILLGEEYARSMFFVDHECQPLKLKGYIGKPSFHRANRNAQYLFVNGRAVFSPFVSKKILEGYATRLPINRFPAFVLHLSLPSDWIDVNVHPQKKEIRLRCEDLLDSFLNQAIEKSLQMHERPGVLSLSFPALSRSAEFFNEEKEEIFFDQGEKEQLECAPFPNSSAFLFAIKARFLAKVAHYYLVEKDGYCLIVDILRARTRVLYEHFLKQTGSSEVQQLLVPLHLEFTDSEILILEGELETLNKMGFSIRSFGQKTFIVDAAPLYLDAEEIETAIRAFIDSGRIHREKKMASSINKRIFSREDAMQIVETLFSYPEANETPDGKRIYLKLTEEELSKRFS